MFPEFQQRLSSLQNNDRHFDSMCRKHTALDQQIQNIETGRATGSSLEIEKLKKEKLHLKDRIYAKLKDGD
ncbi:Uncharacterized protein conserved in bacteria [Bordetella ansorpii]|uniref:Uncharacterized protein conserved in bacteria n=1 Tax=Bordetella ansorpii TaxID=288768 RepID=A0A157SPA6_9BORD|nr:DUF465 domain-containing protein [Bordetella ansorpii]SAI72277.1 Uncharacterized protein conserved in bacteria [Bordetella ansorpii]